MMKKISFVILLCFITGMAQATLLPPGGLVLPPLPLQPPGPLPIAGLVSPYNVDASFNGTVTSWVVAGDPLNPFGGLSFYYQVLNTGTEFVGRFTVSSFAPVPGMPVDVATANAPWDGAIAGGVVPLLVDRSPTGDAVGFYFPGATQIPGGAWSEIMIVHTPAFAWTTGLGAVIDDRAANVNVLVPIPEPATMCLLGLGSLLLIRKKHK